MHRSAPYQPLLLRILHGLSGILVIAAIITGFLVYNTYDRRFGKISFPQIADIQGIHGTFALCFLLVLPAFALYSFHSGQKRLVQSDSLRQLTQVGKPIWWVSLQRLANTLMLIAAILAVNSGRMMKEEWLPAGQLDHIWYSLHLSGWVVMVCCVAIHVLMSIKVGGAPLLLSMLSWKFRPEDSPAKWSSRFRGWLTSLQANFGAVMNNFMQNNFYLRIIEVIVLGGILTAFVLPIFFPG
ncbi:MULTISPECIES: cytochrome b/b6 domain-containing protein [unclassified Nostoc]|uniref:cytochrome b/b6 domain-containing protein n=1 Tax=unclassified Nostoc TaxID=2593658 RepID=UPI0025AAB105|nr:MULTISPECIES: cytochrome b/b6 domain-containing protein [unclassified Nostoc]MDM9584693.1 cytochrome b/b6 domain-containing protein [Nostoc sp. GT001]MDZ7946695.1 cytochrome b/b6 domain-containing protein [Nostoc sp. EfeVER01]MDZ7991939.1 cytochrome b/b6 domain-containing protein [Nostoc sp. EspVER01]